MKFDVLTSQVAADTIEDGAWLHLVSPAGEELFLDKEKTKPVRIKVRSTSSKAYEQHEDTVTRRALSENRKAKSETQKQQAVLAQMKRQQPAGFAALVTGMENVSTDQPGLITPTDQEKFDFASDPHNRWVVDQVMDFARDAENYSSGGVRPGNDSSAGNAEAAPDQT